MQFLLSHRRYPVLLVITLLAGCGGSGTTPPRPPADVRVTAQLDRAVEGVHPASGFIHSLTATVPPDPLVAPLRPRLWRSDLRRAPPARVSQLGARYEVVLSDLWGYPLDNWRGRGPPWRDLRAWGRFVRGIARSQRATGLALAARGRPLFWDVWNEPNTSEYFDGGRRRFMRVYAVAARALRAELGPGTLIGGPSTNVYGRGWLDAVVRCCNPSFVSWHENLDPATPISTIADHLRDARAGPAREREIHVNESVGVGDQYRPGEILGYLAALERGADYAARSCWSEANCRPEALDGLLAPDGKPRSAWWAYRWYAAGEGARVESHTKDPRVAVLASGGDHPAVLIGRVDREAGPPIDVEVVARAVDLDEARATVERLPDSGEGALAVPERLSSKDVDITDGEARVRIRGLRAHEAARVTLTSR